VGEKGELGGGNGENEPLCLGKTRRTKKVRREGRNHISGRSKVRDLEAEKKFTGRKTKIEGGGKGGFTKKIASSGVEESVLSIFNKGRFLEKAVAAKISLGGGKKDGAWRAYE